MEWARLTTLPEWFSLTPEDLKASATSSSMLVKWRTLVRQGTPVTPCHTCYTGHTSSLQGSPHPRSDLLSKLLQPKPNAPVMLRWGAPDMARQSRPISWTLPRGPSTGIICL